MLIQEMNIRECRELLKRLGAGRLGCARDNQPYVVPIYFAYEPDRLYGFSTAGQKIEWMRENPKVCVEVDEVISQNNWSSVVAVGRFEELPEKPEYERIRRQAQAVLEKRAMWWQTAYAAAQSRKSPKPAAPVFYCIHIEEMSGHAAKPDAVESTLAIVKMKKTRR
jgi:nitroimidazol reductase NimA-like FMN-containing flavoprotein (pyridoxamine 5'-phosphate oxidase superfamily)